MDIDLLKRAITALREYGYKRLYFMGGEPLLHPCFREAFVAAQNNFSETVVFTNGTVSTPDNIQPRKEDRIVYNFTFSSDDSFKKNLFSASKIFNRITFNLLIKEDTEMHDLKKRLKSLLTDIHSRKDPLYKYFFSVSLDCLADIQAHKDILNEKLVDLILFLNALRLQVRRDHNLPLCFMGPRLRLITKKTGLFENNFCRIKDGGLLDASFNVGLCEVFSKPTGNFFDKTGEAISKSGLDKLIKKAYRNGRATIREKICKTCAMWEKNCNGTCFFKARKL